MYEVIQYTADVRLRVAAPHRTELLLRSAACLQVRGDRDSCQCRNPERDEAIRQDADDGNLGWHTERDVRCGHPDFDDGDAAGDEARAAEENRDAVAAEEDD